VYLSLRMKDRVLDDIISTHSGSILVKSLLALTVLTFL
jgi:hypothetical protein